MATASAAFADLTVNYQDRRIEEQPGIRRPTLHVVDIFLNAAASQNPQLGAWHTFRPGDDHEADAMEGMARGQSHRRNMMSLVAGLTPLGASTHAPPPPPPVQQPVGASRPPQQAQPKLRVAAQDKPRPRRTTEQPVVVPKPAPKPATVKTEPVHRAVVPQANSNGLAASKWASAAPAAVGTGPAVRLATTLEGWAPINYSTQARAARAAVLTPAAAPRVTKAEARAPTVFRERPKRPPPLRRDSVVPSDENTVPAGAPLVATKGAAQASVTANGPSKANDVINGASSAASTVKTPVTANIALKAVAPVTVKGRGTFTFSSKTNTGGIHLEDTVDSDDTAKLRRASAIVESTTTVKATAFADVVPQAPASDCSINGLPKEFQKLRLADDSTKAAVGSLVDRRAPIERRIRFANDFVDASSSNLSSPITTNTGRPVTPPTEASVLDEPTSTPSPASSPSKGCRNGNILGVCKLNGIGGPDQVSLAGFYVDRYMAEAAFDMLKSAAIKKEDLQDDHKVWYIKGVKLYE